MLASVPLVALAAALTQAQLVTDIPTISRYWGQISPYADNAENHFGVQVTGLPDGCQVEQAHLLQRHAQRFPTGGDDDGVLLYRHYNLRRRLTTSHRRA